MKERRDEPSGGWGLVSINNDEIERHNATVCKNRVIDVSANVKYESQLGNAFTTVDSRKAISGIVTRKRFLLGASEPQCKRDLYSNLISFRFCVVVLISFRFCVVIYHLSLFIWGRPNKGQRIL